MSVVALAAGAPSRRSFLEVWVISIGHSLTHWYPATFYLLLPLIGKELGLNYVEIGTILTCQSLAGAVFNIPGGIIVDALGSRKGMLLAASLFWVGFPYLLMGMTHVYWMLCVCAALVGMGNNFWHPTAIPMIASRFPDRRGLVVSIHAMGGNMGDALAPLAAGALLSLLQWRQVVVVNVIPGIVMSALILLYLKRAGGSDAAAAPARSPERGRRFLGALLSLASNRVLLMLGLSGAFRAMTQSALMTFLPLFLAGQLKYPPAWIGACMFGLQSAGFLAAPVAGHLSDRMGRRRVVMSSMAMSAVVLLFMAVAGRSSLFVLFIAFLGFFLFAIRAVMQAWALDASPRGTGGTSISVLFAMQAMGAAAGPTTAGILADHYGIMAAFYFLACTIVLANLFIVFMPRADAGPAAVPQD